MAEAARQLQARRHPHPARAARDRAARQPERRRHRPGADGRDRQDHRERPRRVRARDGRQRRRRRHREDGRRSHALPGARRQPDHVLQLWPRRYGAAQLERAVHHRGADAGQEGHRQPRARRVDRARRSEGSRVGRRSCRSEPAGPAGEGHERCADRRPAGDRALARSDERRQGRPRGRDGLADRRQGAGILREEPDHPARHGRSSRRQSLLDTGFYRPGAEERRGDEPYPPRRQPGRTDHRSHHAGRRRSDPRLRHGRHRQPAGPWSRRARQDAHGGQLRPATHRRLRDQSGHRFRNGRDAGYVASCRRSAPTTSA